VLLREVASSDAHSLFALISNDPKVEQYISVPPPSAAAFTGFIAWSHRERAAGKGVCFAVVPNGLKQAVGLATAPPKTSLRVQLYPFFIGGRTQS